MEEIYANTEVAKYRKFKRKTMMWSSGTEFCSLLLLQHYRFRWLGVLQRIWKLCVFCLNLIFSLWTTDESSQCNDSGLVISGTVWKYQRYRRLKGGSLDYQFKCMFPCSETKYLAELWFQFAFRKCDGYRKCTRANLCIIRRIVYYAKINVEESFSL